MKKFANEIDKTQYDYDYVIITSRVCGRGNVFVMSARARVCVCVSVQACAF